MGFIASLDKRRWGTALVTLAAAFLCGFVMQTILADDTPVAVTRDAPDAAPGLKNEPPPLPVPPAATLIPILQTPPVMPDRVHEARATGGTDGPARGCTPHLEVEPAPAATLRIVLRAPCQRNARLELRQGPLSGTVSTDRNGLLELRLPALSADPVIEVDIAGRHLSAIASIPEALEYRHVAIQWNGPQALRLHAFEFGATDAGFGHVWSGAPKSPSRAARGSGGFLTRFGVGQGRAAEIYSYPAGLAARRGVVRLVVEAQVNDDNCGSGIQAEAVQSGPFGALRSTEIALSMPDCDQTGSVVRLQNLLQDMRLAGR